MNNNTKILILFLFLAIIFRVSYRLCVERSDRDEVTYLYRIETFSNITFSLKENKDFLLICMGAYLSTCDINPNIGLRVVNLFFSILWIYLMYRISCIIFANTFQRCLVLFFCSFNPYSVRISMMILRDPIYLFLYTLSIYLSLLFLYSRINYSFSLLFPLVSVLSFWTRYEGIELVLIYLITLAFFVILKAFQKKSIRFPFLGYNLLMFAILYGSYNLLLYQFIPNHYKCFFYFLQTNDPLSLFRRFI